jgi:cystathionine beta-lyase/cystathionine gamma-synthase
VMGGIPTTFTLSPSRNFALVMANTIASSVYQEELLLSAALVTHVNERFFICLHLR